MPLYPAHAARTAWALARACHPAPTVLVTTLSTAYAAASGRGTAGAVRVAAAVLAGQLSIGWCNDAVDARRDVAAGRTSKPVAAGDVPGRTVGLAAGAALAACVPLSLAAGGARAGGAHIAGVAAGWAYDLGLKSTAASPLPYAIGFAALPVFAGAEPGPRRRVVAASALLGVGAHLVNVLPDLAGDAATGVRGLPHRLGPDGCRRLAAPLLVGAVALPAERPRDHLATAAAALLTAAGVLAPGGGRVPFRTAMAVAAIAAGLLVRRAGRGAAS